MKILAYLIKILAYIIYMFFKMFFCKHNLGKPYIIRLGHEYKPSFVLHPVTKDKIPVLKREFIIRRCCSKCNYIQDDRGYDTKDIEDKTLFDRAVWKAHQMHEKQMREEN